MQQLHLSIPEPCHEDWQQMTPTEQGRFCNACAKQVVDFSNMSDAQVLNYFSTVKNDKVCGRAYPDQLERAITMPAAPKKRLFWHWNYITMLFLFFSKTNAAKAQGDVKATTVLQPNSFKSVVNINEALQGTVGGLMIKRSTIFKGKVTGERGEAISGATVIIKGSKQGTRTDTEGNYTITSNSIQNVLEISAVGFVRKEIQLKDFKGAEIILTKMDYSILGEVVVVGGMVNSEEFNPPAEAPKHVVVFEIKDNNTQLPVSRASIIIKRAGQSNEDAFVTDKKGTYKLRKIKKEDSYSVKISADGYQTTEFTISEQDIEQRKVTKEVLLNKTETVAITKPVNSPRILMGRFAATPPPQLPLYVVDGVQFTNGLPAGFNWNNVDKIDILKYSEATVLYGIAGSKGAMIVTTKKKVDDPFYKSLDSVKIISSYGTTGCRRTVRGAISVVSQQTQNTFKDSLKIIATKITGALKIYPNPIQKGTAFTIGLKLKDAGTYNVQIIDAAGRMILQQQIVATAKQYTGQLQSASTWGSGVYFIRVFNGDNKMVSTNSILVQ